MGYIIIILTIIILLQYILLIGLKGDLDNKQKLIKQLEFYLETLFDKTNKYLNSDENNTKLKIELKAFIHNSYSE